MSIERHLGPVHGATLLTRDIEKVSAAYQSELGFKLVSQSTVSASLAEFWSAPKLLNAPMQILASSNGAAWLRIVEDSQAQPAKPLKSHGWMSLESNVGNVDKIAAKLSNQYFEVIGEPAYLQVSDAIKAMQVIGPAGEVCYLTQVERPVPPFELPLSDAETGSLFIPVLSCADRAESLAFYQMLNGEQQGLTFDTRVSVLNNAWQQADDYLYPVATLQLDGLCLFEIDQVPQAASIVSNPESLPSGIALITVVCKNLAEIAQRLQLDIVSVEDDYYPATQALLIKGPSGELIELIGLTE